jgi:uncharacterized protein YhdP
MKILKNIFRLHLYLFLFLLVSTFFYVKKGHEYFSIINYFKEDISLAISQKLNKNIKISKINEKWGKNFNFLSNIENISIEGKSVVFKNIDVEINIIESIKTREIVIEKLIINRPEMLIKHNKEKNEWFVKGFEFENTTGKTFVVNEDFLHVVENINIEFNNLIVKTIDKKNNTKHLVLFERTKLSLLDKKIYFDVDNENINLLGSYSLEEKELKISLKGNYFDLESLIKKTPLIEYYKYIDHNWLISANVDLSLTINFNDLSSYDINIRVDNGKLMLKDIDELYLSNISGNLYINENDNLKGSFKTKLYGNHIKIDLILLENNDLQIKSYGYSNIKKINDIWLKNELLSSFSGGSIFKSTITLGSVNKIKLESQLKGITADLPYPFNKKDFDKVNFIFSMNFDNNNTFIHYNKHNIKVNFKKNKIEQVLIGLNELLPKEKKRGIYIQGKIKEIKLKVLLNYLNKKFNIYETRVENSLPLKLINIKGDSISYENEVLSKVSFSLIQKDKKYKMELISNEVNLTNTVNVDSGYYELFIKKINIDFEKKIKESTSSNFDLSKLSNGYIFIDDINILDEQYFDIEIELPKTKQFTMNIFTKYKNTVISANLIYDEEKNRTFFRGNNGNSTLVKGDNILELRERSNAKYPFKSKGYNLDLNINWVGNPLEFNQKTLNGIMFFDMKELEIKNIKENYLGIKILNIFNLSNVFDYLTFDFDSMDTQKVKFKSIRATYMIKDGVMSTSDFKLSGKNFKIKIKGNIDLHNETIKKRIYIETPITDKVPLLSFLAGASPQAAGILFIVEKVIGDKIDKVFEIKMNIVGDWDNIQVKK